MQLRDPAARVGLGTAPLGSSEGGPLWWGPQDRDVAVATVRRAVDVGVAFIDTAPFYGWGRAEEIVGAALGGLRHHPPVFTKCGTVLGPRGAVIEDASPATVRAEVERSRRRLGVERIDIVHVHDPDPTTPIETTWEALTQLVDRGVIGGAGLSNHDVDLMERAHRVGPVAVVQHQYSPLHRSPERDGVLDWCDERGVPFLAWSPLASGFLVDGFRLDALQRDDLRRRLRWADRDAEVVERVRAVARRLADERGVTMVQVVLGWVTSRPGVRAIVGARSPDEVSALATAGLPVLGADELAAFDDVAG